MTKVNMATLFDHWAAIRKLMIANGMKADFTVTLSSDDFDMHLAKALNRDEIIKNGGPAKYDWFRAHKIVFYRIPHCNNN